MKQHWYNKAKPSQKKGDDILTISSPSGTVIKTDVDQFLEQANKFLTTNKISRPKYQRMRLLSLTQWCSKEKDSKTNPFWTSKLHISTHPIHPSMKMVSLKAKQWDCLELTHQSTFEESPVKFKQHLRARGYAKTVIQRSLSRVNFAARPLVLTQKKTTNERILPFVTTYYQAVNNLKQTLMEQWSLIQNQLLLKTIYLKPLITSHKEINL